MEIKSNADTITIQLRYSNFCVKTHLIPVLEYSALQVSFLMDHYIGNKQYSYKSSCSYAEKKHKSSNWDNYNF